MHSTRCVLIATLPAVLLLAALTLLLSCGDDPAAPTRDNPLDPGNPETGGDPFGLVATVEAASIRLDWVRPEGPAIEGFVVLRQDGGAGEFSEKASVSAAVTSWTDTTVGDGHAYAYKVIALGGDGVRSSSDVVTAVAVLMRPFLRLGTGSQWVSSPVVQVAMTSETATHMKLGESPDLPGVWDGFNPPATWDFSATGARGDGDELRLYAKARYPDGSESGVVSDAVTLDLLPPTPSIEIVSLEGATVTVSAAGSVDANGTCPAESLQVRWDWDGDGTWDTLYSLVKTATHTYTRPGSKTIRLGVRDAAGHEDYAETTITIENRDPSAPSNPNPGHEATGVSLSQTLSWTASTDPEGTQVLYDVYFGTTISPPLVSPDQSGTTHAPGPLALETTYYWKVVAKDADGGTADGGVWSFTTVQVPEGMIWIPAGNVRLGEGLGAHDVMVDGFWIGRYEVTNQEYAAFIAAYGYTTEAYWNPVGWNWRVSNNITLPAHWNANTYHGGGIPGNEDFPVNGVSWWEADAYCRWAGGRLPTEAEWEKAAKGGCEMWGDPTQCDAPSTPTYPWGEGISGQRANYYGSGDPYENNGRTTPVGFYDGSNHGGFQTIDSPSPYGLYDVAGNVWEWTSTKYASYPYNANDGRENPPASYNECCRVLRGGSWYHNTSYLRCATRVTGNPYYRDNSGGFRCARTVNP